MRQLISMSFALFMVLFFSCEQAENPVSAGFAEQQFNSIHKVSNLKTPVEGQFTLTNIVTWGDQYANPGDRYFVNGLVADFVTSGSLTGGGQLEQYARYDETFNGPTHGSLEWIIDLNGEQVTLTGRFEGKSYPGDGVNILEITSVVKGKCSSGPVIVKWTIIGPSLGPFTYSGTLITP